LVVVTVVDITNLAHYLIQAAALAVVAVQNGIHLCIHNLAAMLFLDKETMVVAVYHKAQQEIQMLTVEAVVVLVALVATQARVKAELVEQEQTPLLTGEVLLP
jgi:hypothetical protein